MSMTRILSQGAAIAVVAAVVAILPHGLAHAAAPAAKADAKALVEKNGCVACHGIGAKDAKKMGPNYAEVAKKYAKDKGAAGKLAKKIREGGSGSFGAVPMPPQAQVSEADAKAMAEWVLKQK